VVEDDVVELETVGSVVRDVVEVKSLSRGPVVDVPADGFEHEARKSTAPINKNHRTTIALISYQTSSTRTWFTSLAVRQHMKLDGLGKPFDQNNPVFAI